jgi:hypothetical protein
MGPRVFKWFIIVSTILNISWLIAEKKYFLDYQGCPIPNRKNKTSDKASPWANLISRPGMSHMAQHGGFLLGTPQDVADDLDVDKTTEVVRAANAAD